MYHIKTTKVTSKCDVECLVYFSECINSIQVMSFLLFVGQLKKEASVDRASLSPTPLAPPVAPGDPNWPRRGSGEAMDSKEGSVSPRFSSPGRLRYRVIESRLLWVDDWEPISNVVNFQLLHSRKVLNDHGLQTRNP